MSIEGQSVVIIRGSAMGLAIAKDAADSGADVTTVGVRSQIEQGAQAIAGM